MSRILNRVGIRHGRVIVSLAAPTVLTMLSHTLMWTVDSAFLGHVSSLALGAAGLGGLITWTGYCMVNGLSRITSTFVSQANGRGDDRAVGDYTWQGIYIAILGGAILTVAGQQADWLLQLTGHTDEIQANTYIYIRIRTWSAVATQLIMAISGFFQGRKEVKVPMYAGVIANVANIILDYFLIFGFDGVSLGGRTWLAVGAMGIRGAAIATTIAVFLNALILIGFMLAPRANRERYRIHVPRFPSAAIMRNIARIGFPLTLGELIDMLSFSVFTALVGRNGVEALAANQITIQLLSFSFMPTWGITTAATVLVGNEIGRRDPDQAERYGNETYLITLFYTLTLAVILATIGGHLFRIFTNDPSVLAFAGTLAICAAVFQIFDGLRMLGTGVLQGAGDTMYPTLLAFVVLFGVFIPMTWYIVEARGGDVVEAWIVGAFSYLLMALGVFLRYRTGKWKHFEIFDSETR